MPSAYEKLLPLQVTFNNVPMIAPLAPSQDTTSDQLNSFQRPSSIPFIRHSPLPVAAMAQANAAANTGATRISTTIVTQAIASIPPATSTSTPQIVTYLPRPDQRRFMFWSASNPGNVTQITSITVIGDAGSSASELTSSNFGTNAFTSDVGANDGNYWGSSTTGLGTSRSDVIGKFSIWAGRNFSFIARARCAQFQGGSNQLVWIVLCDTLSPDAFSQNPTPSNNLIGYQFIPSVSPNWIGCMSDASGTVATVNTGVPVATALGATLQVDYIASTHTATFTINGNIVGTLSAHPPSATSELAQYLSSFNNGAGVTPIEVRYEYFYVSMAGIGQT
jgi:hypothetical protein